MSSGSRSVPSLLASAVLCSPRAIPRVSANAWLLALALWLSPDGAWVMLLPMASAVSPAGAWTLQLLLGAEGSVLVLAASGVSLRLLEPAGAGIKSLTSTGPA